MTPREAEMWLTIASDADIRSVISAKNLANGWICSGESYEAAINAACEFQIVCCIWPNDLDAALRPKGFARVARKVRLKWRKLTRRVGA